MSPLREPLRFERRFLEKVWGGRALERRPGIALPPEIAVGETWELVDRADENSIVGTGSFAGLRLSELMERHGADILGTAPAAKNGGFPLLVKYLDASENLSVQVHPDDESAAKLGGTAEAKTEAWYVLDARPGSALYAGLAPGVTREHFAKVAAGPGVVETLARWEVRPGECLLVPGGTLHAIGAGITILEVQQNSDTTYRLWDWGRAGREVHVEQALACVRFGEPARAPLAARWSEQEGVAVAPLARSSHFGMNALRFAQPARRSTDGQYQIYAVVGGAGRLHVPGSKTEVSLASGDVWLVPAACEEHVVEPEGEIVLVQMVHRA